MIMVGSGSTSEPFRSRYTTYSLLIDVFLLFLRSLDSDQLSAVLDAMFERRSEPGETIITQV
jgi:hypothetical protein